MRPQISPVICNPAGVPGIVTRRGLAVTRHGSKGFMRPPSKSRDNGVSTICAAAEDPFDRLGVAPDSTKDVIRKAYRKLVLRIHPDLHPDGSDQEFIQVHEAYETLIANKGKPKPKPADGQETWNFHDWHWKFRMSRAFDQQHHKEGTANPYGSTERVQPAHKDQVRSQLQGLHRKARFRNSRKAESSAHASPQHQQARDDLAERSTDSGSQGSHTHPYQPATTNSHSSSEANIAADSQESVSRNNSGTAAEVEFELDSTTAAQPTGGNESVRPFSHHQPMTAAVRDPASGAELGGNPVGASCSEAAVNDSLAASAADRQSAAAHSSSDGVTAQSSTEEHTHLSPAAVGSPPWPVTTTSRSTDDWRDLDDLSHLVDADHLPRPPPSPGSSSETDSIDNTELTQGLLQDLKQVRGSEVPGVTAGSSQHQQERAQLVHCQPKPSRDGGNGSSDQSAGNLSSSDIDSGDSDEEGREIGYQGSSRVRSQLAGLRRKHRLYTS